MASSTLTFKDQDGNPVWGLATRLARGHKSTTEAEDERYPDRSGKTTFLEVKMVLPSPDGHTVHVNYNEGLNPDWKSYDPTSKYFSDIEDPNQLNEVIIIKRNGTIITLPGCPINYNKEQFTSWFNKIRVGSGPTIPNMIAMVPELQKCGMLWQNQGIPGYNEYDWRPRIHQPPIRPDHDSDHNVDCGNLPQYGGGPWVLTFRY